MMWLSMFNQSNFLHILYKLWWPQVLIMNRWYEVLPKNYLQQTTKKNQICLSLKPMFGESMILCIWFYSPLFFLPINGIVIWLCSFLFLLCQTLVSLFISRRTRWLCPVWVYYVHSTIWPCQLGRRFYLDPKCFLLALCFLFW